MRQAYTAKEPYIYSDIIFIFLDQHENVIDQLFLVK